MTHEATKTDDNETFENARVEYAAANDAYMHYDNFTWQVGGVLLAGVFIYWGFIISAPPKLLTLLLGNLLVCLLMSGWILYAAHNRQIYRFKLHRIRELEKLLRMKQHTRFQDCDGSPGPYSQDGPPGHVLDEGVYVIVSILGVLPGISQAPVKDWSWLPLLVFLATMIIALAVLRLVHRIGRRTTSRIDELDAAD